MEDSFIEFLNSLGHPFGTWIGAFLGGITIISGIIFAIIKVKKNYDKKISDQSLKAEYDKNFRESMQTVANTVTSIQTDMTNLIAQHESSITEINTKLEDVWSAVLESQRDSKEGDIALENQIKSYESTLDKLSLKLSNMDEKTNLLIESDMESIKSFIIDKYYQAQEDGYIRLHVLQGLELRYAKYLQENGNTYIEKLMSEIRKMPNDPPTQVRPKTKNDQEKQRRLKIFTH